MKASVRSVAVALISVFCLCPNTFFESVSGLQHHYQSYRTTLLKAQDPTGTQITKRGRNIFYGDDKRYHVPPLFAYRGAKYVSPVMEDRLKRGLLTSADLDRMFSLSENDMEIIERKITVGFLGCIFDLDTVMVDLQKVLLYSYATLAGDLKQSPPSAAQVRDVTGSSLREAIITLGWSVPLEVNIGRFEQRFYEIVDRFIDNIPVTSVPGVGNLIDDTIRDGNKVTVLTALPRGIAIKALKKANLSPIFQGRIDPENLVSPLHLADFQTMSTASAAATALGQNAQIKANVDAQRLRIGGVGAGTGMGMERNSSLSVSSLGDREGLRFDGAAVIKCCGLMRKPGVVSVFISANRRNVLSAKRMGLTVVGIQGFSQASHELRAADKVILDLDSLALRDIYNIARRGIKMSQGPDQQTETASAPVLSVTRSVSAPAKTEDRLPKDTFADEFGSDIM